MVKVTGTQTIPAEWDKQYEGTLTLKLPDGTIRKRYPFRVPARQDGGSRVSPGMILQRQRFKLAINSFKSITSQQRQEWYEASLNLEKTLFYFNYFLKSALMDVLGGIIQGAEVINKIQFQKIAVPTAGTWLTFATAVNPNKVVILQGGCAINSFETDKTTVGYGFAWAILPVFDSLLSSSMWVGWAQTPADQADQSVQIIEYI